MIRLTTDVVVIGSGISGLTAAALLSGEGRKVLVLEKDHRPGGALKRFTRESVPFDIGLHYTGGLGKKQILKAIWKHIGIWNELTAVPLHPEGHDLFRFNGSDTKIRAYYSYELLSEELTRIFPAEAGGIKAYLKIVRDSARRNPFYNPDLPLAPFLRDFFQPGEPSLAEIIPALVKNPELQAVLSAPAYLHGVPPELAGLTMHGAVAHAYYSGAWGIKGGGQRLADALIGRLEKNGVEIISNSPVDRISVADNRVTGVRCAGLERRVRQVIYTGHPAKFPGLVAPGTFRPAYTNRLEALKDTASMFMVFGMLPPDRLPILDRANLYLMEPGLNILRTGVEKATMLMTAPGRRDRDTPETAAGNGLIMMAPASMKEAAAFEDGTGRRRAGYLTWKKGLSDHLIDRAVKTWGADCADIKVLATASPLTLRDELGSPGGGVYGARHGNDQFAARARTKVGGLLLSGQSSLLPGVLGSSLAGLVTAGEISGLEPMWDKIKACL